MLALLIASAAMWMLGMGLSAYYSDIVGRRRVYVSAAVALLLTATVFFTLIDTGSIPVMLVGMLLMAFVLGCTVGPQSALFAELFPAHVRYSGATLGYQVGAILGGGIAPFVATALYAEFGSSSAITAYFVFLSLVSLICTLVLLRRPHVAEPRADQAEQQGAEMTTSYYQPCSYEACSWRPCPPATRPSRCGRRGRTGRHGRPSAWRSGASPSRCWRPPPLLRQPRDLRLPAQHGGRRPARLR